MHNFVAPPPARPPTRPPACLQLIALFSEAQMAAGGGGHKRMYARVRRFYRPQVGWSVLHSPGPGCVQVAQMLSC